MSNHSVISLEINLNKIKHGEGYFKFNSSLVLHPEYQHKIRNVIKETVDINKNTNIVSEYDQEIPQSQTAYPCHREEELHNHHGTPGRHTKQSNQLSLSLPHQDDCKARMDIK